MAVHSAGTVTFLLTDIEHSTRLLAHVGRRYPAVVAEHRRIIAEAVERHGGQVSPMEGDACMATFPDPDAALHAAIAAQRGLEAHDWGGATVRVRMGIHTGEVMLHDGELFGLDLHTAARVTGAAHGGQVLVSQSTFALVGDRLPAGVDLIDRGTHRLKDLDAPVHLYQVQADGLAAEQPVPRGVPDTRHNLPAQPTPFVGRTAQVAAVASLLAAQRLVTLTGPGGVGKTRLALQVGATVAERFPDGVWFVELTATSDPAAVPRLIAAPLGVDLSDCADPAAPLGDALRGTSTLLILDNFEHVIAAAPVISGILAAAPDVRVLVTSRERLLLSGEQIHPVPPLALTADDGRELPDAVELFVRRARSHNPAFAPDARELETIGRICTHVDGLPLAIELAAAQTRLLTVDGILERLTTGLDALVTGARDAPARHRTLRDTIAWSHRLLPEEEQRLFARLSVFRGRRTLDAIAKVCMDGLDVDPLVALGALVDKSMVQRRVGADGEVTFTLLEVLHEFATDALERSGEADQVRRRHAEHFAELAELADDGMLGHDTDVWEDVLNHELANLRAALTWAFSGGDVTLGIRIAAALSLFWYWGGPHDDGRDWVARSLAHPDLLDDATRGRLLMATGYFGYADGDLEGSLRHWEDALAAFRAAGDDARGCWMLSMVALSHARDPDTYDHALRLAEDAVSRARSLPGGSRIVADTLTAMGEVARLGGDDATAAECYRAALAIVEAAGNDRAIATLQSNLAYVAGHAGDHATALRLCRDALERSWKRGHRVFVAWCLSDIAAAWLGLGHPASAARLIGAAEAALERLGVGLQPTDQAEYDRTVGGLRSVLGVERFTELTAQGGALSLEDAVAEALSDPR